MNFPLTILAYTFSSVLGYLALRHALRSEKSIDQMLLIFLAPGFGLILTSFTLFYTFLLFDRLNMPVVLIIHIAALITLLTWFIRRKPTTARSLPFSLVADGASLAALLLLLIPIWIYAHTYSMGGWDAWQVWNFKAKFLYLGNENWKNMLDAGQWRSSPHYPLFLPLAIVWGWIFTGDTSFSAPLFVAVLYTFCSGGLLFSGLKHLTQSRHSLLAGMVLLSLPLFVQFGTSQYCDVVLGYYLLASLICSLIAYQDNSRPMAYLSGALLGALSFTKPEGTIAAMMLFCFNIFFLKRKNISLSENKKTWFQFTLGTFIFTLPAILFALTYSPGNQTFINGLTSADKPSDLLRLQFTLAAIGASLTGRHWVGFWIVMLLGLVWGWKRTFRRELLIVPVFLLTYLLVIIFYYWLNTYFEIGWWMKNTLNRILFSLLPVVVLWAFAAVHAKEKKN